MSYLEFFGLTSEPFSNAPVSRFYFNAPQHQQALTRLLYAVSSMKGLAVLVGDIGAGKTTLARRMLDSLPEDEYEAALLVIIHSGITASWILRRIALQLGVENPAQEKLALLSQLYQRLLQIYEQGRKAVVLIDEAQMLETRELMEEFRGLLNLEVPERKLISFVFFGLPEIEKNLKLDPPLAQRVAMRYRLESFNAESTEAYVRHRMRLAGSARLVFLSDALEAVHRRSGGTPRVINTLCDNALFEAFLARAVDIRGALVEQIADNLGLEAGREQALARGSAPQVAASGSTVAEAVRPPVVPEAAEPEGLRVTATVAGGAVLVDRGSPEAATVPGTSGGIAPVSVPRTTQIPAQTGGPGVIAVAVGGTPPSVPRSSPSGFATAVAAVPQTVLPPQTVPPPYTVAAFPGHSR
jgi:general secretion pathway protein A